MQLVTIAPGHQLDAPAAAAFLRAVADGCPVTITSSYRPPERQASMRADYLAAKARGQRVPFVAAVDDSDHVKGLALDLKDPAIAWMLAHPDYGFVFTDPTERWHVAYRFAADRHLTDIAHPITPPEHQEDDDMQKLIMIRSGGALWIGNGIFRRQILSTDEQADVVYQLDAAGFEVIDRGEVERVDWLGSNITGQSGRVERIEWATADAEASK